MDIHKVDWSAMEWKQIRKGVEQKAFSGSSATVALHRLMPGHEPKPHSHPHEQIAYIISDFTLAKRRTRSDRAG
jgi:quercetin dioxygenase-like cupin family protein